MSTTPNDGGPAFPIRFENGMYQQGITIRDYFAAAALQGLLANPDFEGTQEGFAIESYRLADLMIAERAKTKGGSA
jgi:hypothetical protein